MRNLSTDAQLVAATLSGSLSAFEVLVVRHQDRLYTQALSYVHVKEDAQDALQDAFLNAINQLEALKDYSRFSAWVGQILRNICFNRLRVNRRRQAIARSLGEEKDLENHPDDSMFRNAAFQELLSRLPADSARAFSLHYLEGYSIQGVALEVGKTPSGVKQRLYRARRKLQEEVTSMAKDDRSKHDLPEGFAAQTVARLLEKGRRDRLYMRMDDARTHFGEILEMSPDHPEALIELGRTYDPMDGPSQEEAATLMRAAEAAPDSIDVALELTIAWVGDEEKQTTAIEKCLDLCGHRLAERPDDKAALTAKAQMLFWKRDFEEMEAVARRAVSVAPEDQRCLNYRSVTRSTEPVG